MTDKDKNFDWIQREFIVACDLYEKIIDQSTDDELKDLIKNPFDIWMDVDFCADWEKFKDDKQLAFREKHADTIAELEKQKDDNYKKLAMTDDEKIEFYLQKEKEAEELLKQGKKPFTEPPQEYLDDQKSIRAFFGCLETIYFSLMAKLKNLLDDEFFYFEVCPDKEGDRLCDKLVNHLDPFGNKFLLEEHRKDCDGCDDCDKFRL